MNFLLPLTRGVLSFVFCCFVVTYMQATPISAENYDISTTGIVGWLEIRPEARRNGKGALFTITGHAFAMTDVEGRYTLDVRRGSRNNISNSRQSGNFAITDGRSAQFSHTTINALPADRLEIEMKLFIDNQEVFSVTSRSVVPEKTHRL